MSHWSNFEAKWCKKYTQKLLKNPLTNAFASPIDPKAPWAADYFAIIPNPMDLSTMMKKFGSGQYTSTSQWYDDLDLIWKNAKVFNNKKTTLYSVADYLQKKCEKKYKTMPHGDVQNYHLELEKVNKQLKTMLQFEVPQYSYLPKVDISKLPYPE